MISSTVKASALRNGDRIVSSLSWISARSFIGSFEASSSARHAASMPPSTGSEPHSPEGQA
jgi:hypothetical protein